MRDEKNTLVSGSSVSPGIKDRGAGVWPVIEMPQTNRRGMLSRACSAPFIVLIVMYQWTLSPILGGHCRFLPTCSHYALEAYRTHNPLYATWLTIRRLLRCHPLGGSGWDPPPPAPPHVDP